MNNQLLTSIQHSLFELFDQLNVKEQNGKQSLTVISAFILIQEDNFQIASFGSGTKCVPRKDIFLIPTISRLHSCHAEVIAKRTFQAFLCERLSEYIDGKNDLFEQGSLNHFKLKQKVLFYTSQPPCGSCTISPDSLLYGLSGARPIDQISYGSATLRHPPCSTRVTDEQQLTPSFCCSDKIMLWNVLGVQGQFLSYIIDPIYIDYFMVECREPIMKDSIKMGIDIRRRLNSTNTKSNILRINKKTISKEYHFKRPTVILAKKNFFKYSKFNPLNDEVNKRANHPGEGAGEGGSYSEQSFQSYSYSYSQDQSEKINSLNGLRWGIAKKDENKIKAYSQISKYSLMQKYKQLLRKQTQRKLSINLDNFTYMDLKNLGLRYWAIKHQIRAQFQTWTPNKTILNVL